ncbi:MAG: metal-dependent transcriptional regulator [Acidobacteriota bacterium]|jgi:DtxR family transcriptional regulator, Mn-dependent transcriptional regulator
MAHTTDISEEQQEILEALWQYQEEGRRPAPAGLAGEMRRQMEAAGLLIPDTDRLTPEGVDLARKAIRRHRLAERLVNDLLGGEPDTGEESDACRLEHSLVEGLDEKVCTFLGHPSLCPHGHAIPPGECCRAARQNVEAAIVRMHLLDVGESGEIAYLATSNGGDLQKFLSMGIHPGDRIRILQKSPSFIFQCGHSRFAVDRELAALVFVRRES